MSGHHLATVRRAGRKRGARFESSEALAEQPAVVRSHGVRVRDFTVKPGSAFRFHIVCEVHSETEMCEMPDVTSSSKLPGDLWWTSSSKIPTPQFHFNEKHSEIHSEKRGKCREINSQKTYKKEPSEPTQGPTYLGGGGK